MNQLQRFILRSQIMIILVLILSTHLYASVSLVNMYRCETKYNEDMYILKNKYYLTHDLQEALYRSNWVKEENDFISACSEKYYYKTKFKYALLLDLLNDAQVQLTQQQNEYKYQNVDQFNYCEAEFEKTQKLIANAQLERGETEKSLETSLKDARIIYEKLDSCRLKLLTLEREYGQKYAHLLKKLESIVYQLKYKQAMYAQSQSGECQEVRNEVNSFLEMLTPEYMKESQLERLEAIKKTNLVYLKNKINAYTEDCRSLDSLSLGIDLASSQLDQVIVAKREGTINPHPKLLAFSDRSIQKNEFVKLETAKGIFTVSISVLFDPKNYTYGSIRDDIKKVMLTKEPLLEFIPLKEEYFRAQIITKLAHGYTAFECISANSKMVERPIKKHSFNG